MVQEELEFALRSDQAQALILVRAMEEDDVRGSILSHEIRRQATADAREGDQGDAWIVRRAELLVSQLAVLWPFLRRLLRWVDVGHGLWLPVAGLALVLGLSTNALGPDRRINVLALPLAGILAWNIMVLFLLAFRRLVPIGRFGWRGSRPYLLEFLEAHARRLVEKLSVQGGREPRPGAASSVPVLPRQALLRFLKEWFATLSPLSAARLRGLLHLASLVLLGGVVLGMYLRGILFEYEAVWESTFLTAESVEGILGFVLAPASWLLGMEISSALEARTAAPLIHLWAVTAAWVALPRVLLFLAEILRMAHFSRRLPVLVPRSYPHRLLAAVSSDAHRVDVIPYSYTLVAALSDTLRARLLDVFGVRADIVIHNPMEYGAQPREVDRLPGRCWLVVFNLSQTPEVEVHGGFLRFLSRQSPEGQTVIPVVEASSFRQRWPEEEAHEKRWRERKRAWDRVITEAGMRAVHLDFRHDDANSLIAVLSERVTEADV